MSATQKRIYGFLFLVFGVSLVANFYLFQHAQASDTKATVVAFGVDKEKIEALEKLKAINSQDEADRKLGQYAINMMYRTSAKKKLSDAKKQILARAIVRVANDVFDSQEHRQAFVAVLAIESGFDRIAQSPTGPKGYAQVAKTAFKEGMASCGVTNLNDEDVWETDINLYAGACYFRSLLEQNGGDPYIAIVAYNQGPASDSARKYSASGDLDNIEALKYVARFNFLKRVVSESITPNAPAIESLQKPGKSPKVEANSQTVKKSAPKSVAPAH